MGRSCRRGSTGLPNSRGEEAKHTGAVGGGGSIAIEDREREGGAGRPVAPVAGERLSLKQHRRGPGGGRKPGRRLKEQNR